LATTHGSLDTTILHVSDTQFGAHHRFTGDGPPLASTMVTDLRRLLGEHIERIDLIVISGDIAERSLRSEFEQARQFIDALCNATGVDHPRVVVVPGNHDVNWSLCNAYFAECEADEASPRAPFSKKWKHYQQFVTDLHGPTAFTEDQPYRVHTFQDLGVVIAALNSTMEETHLKDGHYGWCGHDQLTWAHARLAETTGLARIGVLHHNARRKAVADNENLRDEDALTTVLAPQLDLLLHGHTHDGKRDHLADGTLVLATGSAAVTADWRPADVPNQFQILRLRPDHLLRHGLQWDGKGRWIGDTRVSDHGDSWQARLPFSPPAPAEPDKDRPFLDLDRRHGPRDGRQDFVSQVLAVTTLAVPDAEVKSSTSADGLDYLIAVAPARPLLCVGIVGGPADEGLLDQFDSAVFDTLRARGQTEFVVVHHGTQNPDLCRLARERGVQVKTWTEYNNLLDLGAYRSWLRDQLNNDQLYPQGLYLPQRYRTIDRRGKAAATIQHDLLARLYDDLLEEDGRFVLVLGDAGYGKSFLVRRLAHRLLANERSIVTPIVIYLRERDKGESLDEMVARVLIDSRASFNVDRFQHSLRAGTLALLVDGYDEFAVRVGYENAAAQLDTFVTGLQGRAKILLTTRPNHFRSADHATSALFDRLQSVHHGRVVELEPFDETQQHAFLTRWFELSGADTAAAAGLADRWMVALGRVDNLPELARTPRMLSFMVQDLDLDGIERAASTTTVTAAALYQKLVDRWLSGEGDIAAVTGMPVIPPERRQRLLEQVAVELWRAGDRDLSETDLQQAARVGLDLPTMRLTVDQAAQLVGGRTLFRASGGRWKFAHQSVWEFLLANHLAHHLRTGGEPALLGAAELTRLTARFLRDLAPAEAAAWIAALAEPRPAPEPGTHLGLPGVERRS
jgi:3',5'-cyclic AMP phosphodiesterase CpdA